MIKSKKINGFTLAEVLIVIGIIGVVAQLTIPALINSFQKKVYVTRLEKFYSTFNQALLTISNDYDCPGDLACTGVFNQSSVEEFGDAIVPFFKVAKNCRTSANNDCFTKFANNQYDGKGTWNNVALQTSPLYYRFMTIEGVSITIYGNKSTYNNCEFSNGTGPNSKVCGQVRVDVNGLEPPNFYGRDFFTFYITNGKGAQIAPSGWKYDNSYWKTKDGGTCQPSNPVGIWCAGRVIEEGWQMNY